jgi:hypothetical protein
MRKKETKPNSEGKSKEDNKDTIQVRSSFLYTSTAAATCMLLTIYHNRRGVPKKVDQCTMKVVEEEEHKMFKIQAFIPIVSNENKVKDVSLPKMFVITLEEGTHGCSHTNTKRTTSVTNAWFCVNILGKK